MNRPDSTRHRRIDYRPLVGYLLLVGGCISSGWLLNNLVRALPTQDWPTTNGLIYEASVVYTTSYPFDKNRGFFHTVVDYQYRVKGDGFSGDKVYLRDIPYLSKTEADQRVTRFAAGSIHPVAYDPENPANSVLLTGSPEFTWNLLMPSAFFLLIGAGLSGIFKRKPKPNARHD